MKTQQRLLPVVIALSLLAWAAGVSAQAPKKDLAIGVVDLTRLVNESPQAERAQTSMARQFARRKNEIESKTDALRQDMERLKQNASDMSEADRDALQTRVRDRQRALQMQQSKYNDDVDAAEEAELEQMRADIRAVVDRYAADHGYDLILGDSVLYAVDAVDVTDEVLAQLKTRE